MKTITLSFDTKMLTDTGVRRVTEDYSYNSIYVINTQGNLVLSNISFKDMYDIKLYQNSDLCSYCICSDVKNIHEHKLQKVLTYNNELTTIDITRHLKEFKKYPCELHLLLWFSLFLIEYGFKNKDYTRTLYLNNVNKKIITQGLNLFQEKVFNTTHGFYFNTEKEFCFINSPEILDAVKNYRNLILTENPNMIPYIIDFILKSSLPCIKQNSTSSWTHTLVNNISLVRFYSVLYALSGYGVSYSIEDIEIKKYVDLNIYKQASQNKYRESESTDGVELQFNDDVKYLITQYELDNIVYTQLVDLDIFTQHSQ